MVCSCLCPVRKRSQTYVKQLPVPKLARKRAHRAVVAWMCRKCKRQRLKKAKLKYRRVAQKLLGHENGRFIVTDPWDCANMCKPEEWNSTANDEYISWLRQNCGTLAGGAAKTKKKRENQRNLATLMQMFNNLSTRPTLLSWLLFNPSFKGLKRKGV